MSTLRLPALVLAAVACAASVALAGDWPQWRGPNRDGVATGAALPAVLPPGLKALWQVPAGPGHSGPIVSGDKVVVFSRQGDDEVLACLDAAGGKEAWRKAFREPYDPPGESRSHGKGPFATPAVAAGKVYAFGVTGVLTCCDLASGKMLWRNDFASDFKKTHPTWGAANSPMVEGDLCILSVGSRTQGGLAAFEKDTGKRVWLMKEDGAAYASPVAAVLAGRRQAVTLLDSNAVGVELATGKLLWTFPFRVKYEQNIVTPLAQGDLVVVSGWGEGTAGLRIAAGDDGLAAAQAWKNEADGMYMSSPVRNGFFLYGLSTRQGGTLVCLSLRDGTAAWSSPGGLGEYASILRAGDRLLVLTVKGELILLAADPAGYNELGRTRIPGGPFWAHLALAGGRLFVKDETNLTCYELPAAK